MPTLIPLERTIEQSFVRKMKVKFPKFLIRKLNGEGYRSWPDRMIVGPDGFIMFIELKRPKIGKLSEGQTILFKDLTEFHHPVFIVTDAEEGLRLVERRLLIWKAAKRFWPKVRIPDDNDDECWGWIASSFGTGYGCFQELNLKIFSAHRYSYELAYGEIPPNLNVCHHCDNPKCVRPTHLFLGTNADNQEDMISKGRQSCGEDHTAKLKEIDIPKIRELFEEGCSHNEIAKKFNISRTNVTAILNGKSWKHVK